ncbi:MAG: hypothetical protein GY928_31525 [Colwellia sp.]|nr:hypothetical protein [Colwellia sp.]
MEKQFANTDLGLDFITNLRDIFHILLYFTNLKSRNYMAEKTIVVNNNLNDNEYDKNMEYKNITITAADKRFKINKVLNLWLFYHNIKCSNQTCQKIYFPHKYEIEQLSPSADYKNIIKTSWYICKGDHLTYYCSRTY